MFFAALSKFVQFLIDAVGSVLGLLVSLLPGSPFSAISASPEISALLGKINFFLPIYEFIAIMESWLVAVAVYYLYSIWARWVKAID